MVRTFPGRHSPAARFPLCRGQGQRCERQHHTPREFAALLDMVEQNLSRIGREIFAGEAAVSPCKRGSVRACDQCSCQAVCRIDPWQHSFRVLSKVEERGG